MNTQDVEMLRLQCLQRNARYQNDYADLVQTLGMEAKTFDRQFHPVWLALYMRTAKEVEKEFPGVDIDQIRRGFLELGRFKEKWGLVVAPNHSLENGSGHPIEVLGDPASGEAPYLTIKINLSYSKSELRQRFDSLLDVSQKLFEPSSGEGHSSFQDPTLLQLQKGLALFDAIEKQNLTFEQAFQNLFPQAKELSAEVLTKITQEARQNLEQVKLLIAAANQPEKFLGQLG